jgi:hypothetical protein
LNKGSSCSRIFLNPGGRVQRRVLEFFGFWFPVRKDLQVVQSGERTNAAGKPVANRLLLSLLRGAVKIVNRKKLEDFACECYAVIRQYDGDLGLK